MSTLIDLTRTGQEQFLETVRQSQKAVVDAVGAWAKAVEGAVPASPAVPGAGDLPKPEDMIENAFDFAEKLLEAQREFARNLIAATSPVLEKTEKPAPRRSTQSS